MKLEIHEIIRNCSQWELRELRSRGLVLPRDLEARADAPDERQEPEPPVCVKPLKYAGMRLRK